MSVIENLRQAIDSSNQQQEERLEQAESIRKEAEGILRNGSRRLRPVFYASLPFLPIMTIIEFATWPFTRENPIDVNTQLSFKREVEGIEVEIRSFNGVIRNSDITVDIKNLGRLRLGPLAALAADISPDEDIYHASWWKRPIERFYRTATLDELNVFSDLVQKVNPNPKSN